MENSENLSNMLARSIFCFLFLFEITNARSSLQQQHHSIEYQTAPPYRVKQCREGCLEKVRSLLIVKSKKPRRTLANCNTG